MRHKDDPPQRLKFLRISPTSTAAGGPGRTLTAQRASLGGTGPCADHLAALIACWRAHGVDAQRCGEAVAVLTNCAAVMQQSQAKPNPITSINRTLQHYYKRYIQ